MAEENVELVRSLYEDPRGLLTAGAEMASEDLRIDLSELYPDRPVMSGVESGLRFRDQGPWAEVSFEAERFFEIGSDRVIVLVRAVGIGRQSGAQVTAAVAHEFLLENGVIVGFKVYADQAQALRAAGLSDSV